MIPGRPWPLPGRMLNRVTIPDPAPRIQGRRWLSFCDPSSRAIAAGWDCSDGLCVLGLHTSRLMALWAASQWGARPAAVAISGAEARGIVRSGEVPYQAVKVSDLAREADVSFRIMRHVLEGLILENMRS